MNWTAGRIVGLVFALLGLFTLVAGGFYAYESFLLVQEGRSTEGIVVDFHQQVSSEDQQVRYAPIVEYRVGGATYRFASASYANSPAFEIGETLPVRYLPEQPDQARLDRFGSLWGLPLGLGLAGLLMSLAGAGMALKKDGGKA